jgi:hypothetical protein
MTTTTVLTDSAATATEREPLKLRKRIGSTVYTANAFFSDRTSETLQDKILRLAKFLALARKYPDFDELTPQMLHEFVDRVYIHEAERIDGERRQQIDIYLNFIGEFKAPVEPAPESTPEETVAAEKERARRQHLREYHKRWRGARKAKAPASKADAETNASGA